MSYVKAGNLPLAREPFDSPEVDVAKMTESESCRSAVTAIEPKVKVASQSVFYTLLTHHGICSSGCGVSQTHIAEVVFGIEIVEWDLCSVCLSRTGFLEYFNSLPSATPREAEEVRILLGTSNETLERQNRVARR